MFPTVEHVMVWFTGLVGLKMFKNVEILNVSDGLESVKYQLVTCQTFYESYSWPIWWLIYYDPTVVKLTSGNEVGNLIQNDIIVKGGRCLGLFRSR